MIGRLLAVLAVTLMTCRSLASAQEYRAAALFARGDFQAAASAYEAHLRVQPDDRSAEIGLATIRLYQNDLSAAEPLLDSVLYVDPQNSRASQLLAEVMRRREESKRRATLSGSRSTVPFLTSNPLPVVPVVANGVATNFLIDTGADVEVEPAFARRLGLVTEPGGTGTFAGGLHAAMRRGMLKSLTLGGATAFDVPIHVVATHVHFFFPSLHVDGIVGTTYFERFLVTIDYPRNELVLRPRSNEVSAAFEAAANAAGASVVPCYLVGDHYVFARAQVNASAPGLYLFDTGLAGGGLMATRELVNAAAISLDRLAARTGVGGGGALTAVPFVAQHVAVGSAIQRNVAGIYTPQGNPFALFPFTVWGAISNDFLRAYAYTVDFDAMKLVLEAPMT